MKKELLLSFLFLTLTWHAAFSQINRGGTPKSFQHTQLKEADVPIKTMPAIDLLALQLEDAANNQDHMPWRFANPFPVDLNLKNSGRWDVLPNGDRIWRLRIACPDALSINLTYRDFFLPKGSLLYLYNTDKTQILGAFSSHNNSPSGRFGTALLHDEMITIEYYEPKAVQQQGRIAIDIVAHGYRPLGESNDNVGPGNSGNCQVDVNCAEGNNWQDEKKGVARIVVNGSISCSGSLINNERADCTPYFLTADHCIGSLNAPNSTDASAWCFYWNFERPDCNNGTAVSTPYQTTVGATLVSNDGPSDFALFLLTENPNDVYDVYYNGWNATNITGTGGTGIHHPSGDAKKIATHTIQPFDDDWFGSSPTGSHWEVAWAATPNGHSVTEGGSSGSPLFDANSRIIGQLHGGSSINCTNPANDPGIYGKVSYSWTNNNNAADYRRLKDWLDPDNTGTTTLDGAYLCNDPTVYFETASSTIAEQDANIDAGCLDYLERDIIVKITRAPSQPATLTVAITGTATGGSTADYTLDTVSLTLTSTKLSDTIRVRVFDDAYVEGTENVVLQLNLAANGGNAILNPTRDLHTLNIEDDDEDPSNATIPVTVFAERFNTGLGGWTVNDGGSSTDTWSVVNGYLNNTSNTLGGADFVFVNSDAAGSGSTSNEVLTSPSFNGLNMTALSLEFDEYLRVYDGGTVETMEVRVFDGTTWQSVFLRDEDDGSAGAWNAPNHVSIDITPYASANMQVQFIYLAAWDYWWAIDNVEVIGQAAIAIQTKVSTGVFDTQYLGPNETVHFYDPTAGSVMLSIENLSAHDYGCTEVYVENAGASAQGIPATNVGEVTSKSFRVVPSNNNANGAYNISLYYTTQEIDGWVADNTGGNTAADLVLVKSPGNIMNASTTTLAQPTVSGFSNGSGFSYTANFATGFSGFALGNNLLPLPIELLNFDGKHVPNEGNHLTWTSLSEINSDHFVVERSFDGMQFTSIGKVAAQGNTQERQTYNFLDQNISTGKYYYRLKIVDTDGSFEYSKLISLVVARAATVAVYPNPVKGNLNIDFKESISNEALVRIYSATGILVWEQNIKPDTTPVLRVDMRSFAEGVYLIQVQQAQDAFQYKVVKH